MIKDPPLATLPLTLHYGDREDVDGSWLKDLPDHALRRILHAKHDCVDGLLGRQIADVWWDRYAVPTDEWITESRQIVEGVTLTSLVFCGRTKKAKPDSSGFYT